MARDGDIDSTQQPIEGLRLLPIRTIHVAEVLTGRHGSNSQPVGQLRFSYEFRSDEVSQHEPLLKHVMCLAATTALKKILSESPRIKIKWPNILWSRDRLVGEVNHSLDNGITKVIAVIKMNKLENGDKLKQAESVTTFINKFEHVYSLLQREGLGSFWRLYRENSKHRDERLPLVDENDKPMKIAVNIVGLANSGYLQAVDANKRGNGVPEYEVKLSKDKQRQNCAKITKWLRQ